jgi:Na+/phosphate symporter
LIIALEDKIDQIDFQIHTHLHSITDNLVRMADFQQRSWEQIDLVKEKLDTIGAILNLPAEEPVLEISAPKKTDSLKKKNKARNETTG